MLVKNSNFCQKSKFWSKIQILVKNRNFGQKSLLTPFLGGQGLLCRSAENISKKNIWNLRLILKLRYVEIGSCLILDKYVVYI